MIGALDASELVHQAVHIVLHVTKGTLLILAQDSTLPLLNAYHKKYGVDLC